MEPGQQWVIWVFLGGALICGAASLAWFAFTSWLKKVAAKHGITVVEDKKDV